MTAPKSAARVLDAGGPLGLVVGGTAVLGAVAIGFIAVSSLNKLDSLERGQAASTTAVSVLDERLARMQKSLDSLALTAYSATDALRDFRLRDQKDMEQDRRIGSAETRIDKLETAATPAR